MVIERYQLNGRECGRCRGQARHLPADLDAAHRRDECAPAFSLATDGPSRLSSVERAERAALSAERGRERRGLRGSGSSGSGEDEGQREE